MGIYKEYATKYWDNGYVTVACDGKNPKINDSGWEVWPDDESEKRIKLLNLIKKNPNANFGFPLCPQNKTSGLDFDIYDPVFLDLCLKQLPPIKIGKSGFKGLTCFTNFIVRNQNNVSEKFVDHNGNVNQIEFLSAGRFTVLPPSIHPDNNLPYKWITQSTFENTSIDDLDFPEITNEDIDNLFLFFKEECIRRGYTPYQKALKENKVQGSKGRNIVLGNIACAMIRRGEPVDKIIAEVLNEDEKKFSDDQLFLDKKEKIKGKTREERAKTFVESWVKYTTKTDKIDYAGGEIKIDNSYSTKDNGFFIKKEVPTKGGEVKIVWSPDYKGMNRYFKNELKLVTTSGWAYLYDDFEYKKFDSLLLDKTIDELTSLKPTVEQVGPQQISSFKQKVFAHCLYRESDFIKTDGLINLKNGVLNIKNRTLVKHSHEYFFKYRLPYDYDKNAQCKKWLEFLNDVLDKDKVLIETCAEIIGYTLLGGKPFLEKAFLLYGTTEGANGKSVFLNVLSALLGDKNISTVMMSDLKEKYSAVRLDGMIANIARETPSNKHLNSAIFNNIVTGEPVNARDLYKSEYSFNPTCRLFFACNEAPVFESIGGALRRIYPIAFQNTISADKRDSQLSDNIIQSELPGIFNWALNGLDELLKRKYLRESETTKKILEDIKTSSDIVYDFLKSTYRVEKDVNKTAFNAMYHVKDLFSQFLDYCARKNADAAAAQLKLCTFSKRVSDYIRSESGVKSSVYKVRDGVVTKFLIPANSIMSNIDDLM